MIEINGKQYPLWSQFVENKNEWIGGDLRDLECLDYGYTEAESTTKITDIKLKPNGSDSAYFEVNGEKFTCGFDVTVGGIGGRQKEGWLTFTGYGGHTWMIRKHIKV